MLMDANDAAGGPGPYVVSFPSLIAPQRFDHVPWGRLIVEEASTADGPWMPLASQALSPLDEDPAVPATRDVTIQGVTLEAGWYRFTWSDDLRTSTERPVYNGGAWAPSVQDVADLCAAYTRRPIELGGDVTGSFDSTTEPTDAQVRRFIVAACREVAGRVGVSLTRRCYALAAQTAAWHAAAAVEMSRSQSAADDAASAASWKTRNFAANLDELTTQARRRPLRLT